ncbi:MAG TPA: Sir2 family NAD-dependent protein deacetylase [Gemmataceae bacterium]|nr:Sir2 family NAD-dependent protein deacetylase [Gemmataceae bacterium]
MSDANLQPAAEAVASAEALLIGAGAGMGVDSGLPDFRGNEGFWNAYPPYAKLRLSFSQLANPRWFADDPAFAWGFYGHRLNLYRAAQPHDGFRILLSWARRMSGGAFVYTSNVDGHFQRAGFDAQHVLEVHGAIDWMQCTRHCGADLFAADSCTVEVEESTMRAREPLPACPGCGALARPNILMFGDDGWDYGRAILQEERFRDWLQGIAGKRLVIVECGAGTAIPTVRHLCEHVAKTNRGRLIRVNVREAQVPAGGIGLATGALAALRAIDALLPRG